MQSDFEASSLKQAKQTLSKELEMAERIHALQKSHQKEKAKKPSLWQQITGFFRRLF